MNRMFPILLFFWKTREVNPEYFHHGVGGNLQGSLDNTTVLQEGDSTDLVVPAVEELP